MNRCSIVDEPSIEGDAVVVRVIHEDPRAEDSGRVFICRFKGFDDMTIETFPKGQTPASTGSERAEAAEFARTYAEQRLEHFSALFEELARRQR